MDDRISRLFHQISKTGLVSNSAIPSDESLWPKEWKETEYKAYPRMPAYRLSAAEPPSADLFKTLLSRKSERVLRSKAPSKETLSLLLKYSCGEITADHRVYPSGGALYPVEAYPILFSSGELPAGAYHYNFKNHSLEHILAAEVDEDSALFLNPATKIENISFTVILTVVFHRTQQKYGERGYRLALLEAGHIAQNLLLVSTALGFKSCAISGTKDPVIETMLDIDGETESLVYGIIFG